MGIVEMKGLVDIVVSRGIRELVELVDTQVFLGTVVSPEPRAIQALVASLDTQVFQEFQVLVGFQDTLAQKV